MAQVIIRELGTTVTVADHCDTCGVRISPVVAFDNNDSCVACYALAELENSHSDGWHEDTPHDGCPWCEGPLLLPTPAIEPTTIEAQPSNSDLMREIKKLNEQIETIQAELKRRFSQG